ncbi:MAG: molybdate ABC transporter substrate-binding protein [Chloroflexota bacterium]
MKIQRGWLAGPVRLAAISAIVAGLAAQAAPVVGGLAAPVIACSPATPAAAVGAAPPAATPLADATAPAAFPAAGGEVTVFAAASLTEAFTTMGDDLEAAHPGLEITFNFAGSQALVTQMTGGAEADVFAPANLTQMAAAADAGLIAGEPVPFARNRLAVAAPASNPAGIDEAADLARDGVKLVLALPEVPAGRYAREAICAMGDAAFVEAVAANVVSEEEDVRDVLAKVQLGEADAGIVYVTDARAGGDQVLTVAMPAGADPVAVYPIAATAEGDRALAEAFIGYVLSAEGQATLAEFGFEPAGA